MYQPEDDPPDPEEDDSGDDLEEIFKEGLPNLSGPEYIIDDLTLFTDSTRALVFNSFNRDSIDDDLDLENAFEVVESRQKDLDRLLSHNESVLIIGGLLRKQRNKNTKAIRHTMTDNSYAQILDSLHNRLVSNILQSLVNKGLINSGFDSEKNFVFWIDEKDENKNTKTD